MQLRLAVMTIAITVALAATSLPISHAARSDVDVDPGGDRGYHGRTKISIRDSGPGKPSRPNSSPSRSSRTKTPDCAKSPKKGVSCGTPEQQKVTKALRNPIVFSRTLLTQIQIPDPTPIIGPDPNNNEWHMTAVGYPNWLWTEGPTTITDTVTAYGVTFRLTGTWNSTTFRMGDGHRVSCTRTTAYPANAQPGSASPTCGYSYRKASPKGRDYIVSGTTNWTIRWSAQGFSGTLPASFTGNRRLTVGELNALIKAR